MFCYYTLSYNSTFGENKSTWAAFVWCPRKLINELNLYPQTSIYLKQTNKKKLCNLWSIFQPTPMCLSVNVSEGSIKSNLHFEHFQKKKKNFEHFRLFSSHVMWRRPRELNLTLSGYCYSSFFLVISFRDPSSSSDRNALFPR